MKIDRKWVVAALVVAVVAVPSTSSFVGAQLAKIADTSRIQAELKVDEADIARVSVGQAADVYAAAFPDDALKGKVEQIALAPTVEGQGRAYKVTVALLVPPKVELRSGMSVRAEISLGDGGKRPAVPVEAIVTEMGEDKQAVDYIWKVTDGKARKVKVATGISDDAFVTVGKPLVVGDVVVRGPSRSMRQLQDGARVEQRKAGSGDAADKDADTGSDKDGEPGKDG